MQRRPLTGELITTMQLTDSITGKTFCWNEREPNHLYVYPRTEPGTYLPAEARIVFDGINPVTGIPAHPDFASVVRAYLAGAVQNVAC